MVRFYAKEGKFEPSLITCQGQGGLTNGLRGLIFSKRGLILDLRELILGLKGVIWV